MVNRELGVSFPGKCNKQGPILHGDFDCKLVMPEQRCVAWFLLKLGSILNRWGRGWNRCGFPVASLTCWNLHNYGGQSKSPWVTGVPSQLKLQAASGPCGYMYQCLCLHALLPQFIYLLLSHDGFLSGFWKYSFLLWYTRVVQVSLAIILPIGKFLRVLFHLCW